MDDIYKIFEDKFRGSREIIKDRLSIYRPFLKILISLGNKEAIDLGCGRGEWLEVLNEEGFNPTGFDLNLDMVNFCQTKGFNVKYQDAIESLKNLKDNSVSIISGFHIIEHLSFEKLQILVKEAHRILMDGGLLLLETPNSENIQVATSSFYLDPTHTRPVPSLLLSFLAEHYNFEKIKILKLQENRKIHNINDITISNIFKDVSPDYAIIAQKNNLGLFNELFDRDYGISLDELLQKFENRIVDYKNRIANHENRIANHENRIANFEQQLIDIKNELEKNKNEMIERDEKILYLINSLNELKASKIRIFLVKILNKFPNLKKKLKSILKKDFSYQDLKSNRNQNEILIDITHVYNNDLKTGIQRVVRNISKEILNKFSSAKLVYLTDKDGYWVYKYVNNPSKIVVPIKNDVFIGLDLNSSVIGANDVGLFNNWIERGVNINFVVYDILPVLYPQWWGDGIGFAHEKWLKTILNISNKIICISQSVKKDVNNYLDNHKSEILNNPELSWFHLGADISGDLSKGIPNDYKIIIEKLDSKLTFVIISTIEPRKGHVQTLKAFESLWEYGYDINLVIVGKNGWMMETFIDELTKHKELNNRLFWLNGISDEYLEKVYNSVSCVMVPSEAEGFGLPIIEAAQHNKPIIVRDIPVFREVAGESVYYFENTKNPENLEKAIIKWIELYKNDDYPKSTSMQWLTWNKSADKFIDIVLK